MSLTSFEDAVVWSREGTFLRERYNQNTSQQIDSEAVCALLWALATSIAAQFQSLSHDLQALFQMHQP